MPQPMMAKVVKENEVDSRVQAMQQTSLAFLLLQKFSTSEGGPHFSHETKVSVSIVL